MPSIYGFVYAMSGGRIGRLWLTVTVLTLSIAVLLFIACKWGAPRRSGGDNLMFAAAVAGSLLSGSHMFTHDFSPLLLAMFLAWASLPTRSQGALRVALIFTLVVFWLPPVYFALVAF